MPTILEQYRQLVAAGELRGSARTERAIQDLEAACDHPAVAAIEALEVVSPEALRSLDLTTLSRLATLTWHVATLTDNALIDCRLAVREEETE